MSAEEDLRTWSLWQRVLAIWRSDWGELEEYVSELAPSIGHEEKTLLCFCIRYGRQVASTHAFTLGRILRESPDQHARKLAVTALAIDELRPHELTIGEEALIEREKERIWEALAGRLAESGGG